MAESILSKDFMVKPSDCNAGGKLPLTALVAQMIELATDHANILGIGFLSLEPHGLGWVLSRLSVEMKRWPANGECYILSTWIESYNQHFSERCFSVKSSNGEILGYARTIWVIIDLQSHNSVGTAGTILGDGMIADLECPIPKFMRHKAFVPEKSSEYVFQYSDIDFYRHVNTVKYIALLLNQFSIEDFDSGFVSRFDIAFAHEAKYGETVVINSIDEKVPSPSLARHSSESFRRSFTLEVNGTLILTSSIVLSEL